jgi:hypothetical protein
MPVRGMCHPTPGLVAAAAPAPFAASAASAVAAFTPAFFLTPLGTNPKLLSSPPIRVVRSSISTSGTDGHGIGIGAAFALEPSLVVRCDGSLVVLGALVSSTALTLSGGGGGSSTVG